MELRSRRTIRLCVAWLGLLCVLILAGSAHAAGDVHWTYTGERGAAHWGELSEAFSACSEGKQQSPIDIVHPVDAELGPIELSYPGSTTSILNNGHTLQVDVGPGNTLLLEGQTFELLQFHLHSPSEHRIAGEAFPIEVHFVHRNDQGELAVVGVLLRQGTRSEVVGRIEAAAPAKAGQRKPFVNRIPDLSALPKGRAYYRYSGSLTTPPCSEGVRWVILEETGAVSPEQVKNFVDLIGEDARGPQPLNGRIVLY